MATETVTILFTDLVGSTELANRVGPEQAEHLRIEHFSLLREALDAHGGREVKNLGDGLMVAFGGTSGALGAAVAMQQAFEARNRDADEPMEIRIGISAGEADVDGDDYFGTPVVEASRLCDAATGGQIVVSDLVRTLAGSRGGHTLEPLGALDLKGLDDVVTAHQLGWVPLIDVPAAGIPIPRRLERDEAALFVGREAEHALLADALKEVEADRQRRIVLIGGEPGIGKTSLVTEFVHRAHTDGALVTYGRCDEELAIPYQPWREAIGHLVEHGAIDRESVSALLDDGAASDTSDADGARYQLYRSTLDALGDAAEAQPVIVVLDDLHWADAPTVALLRRAATRADPTRLLLVATFRDADIAADHPMADALAALHREEGVQRIPLSGLGDLDVLALLESLAGHEMTDEGLALRDALIAETGGNPFFTTEILNHLAETGAIVQSDDGQWVGTVDIAAHGLPVSVREVVGRRVANLGDETQRLLRYAAVIGRDFDLDLLADVADLDVDRVLDLLEPVEGLGVIATTASDRCSFTHALVVTTLIEELSASRRARVHRAIAETLESTLGDRAGERSAEIAHHWNEATGPQDATKAIESSRRAGDYALANLAPDEARRWYQRGLDLIEGQPGESAAEHLALLIGLGKVQRQTGDDGYLATLLRAGDLAVDLGDDDALVRAALATNRGRESSVGDTAHDVINLLERVATIVEGEASARHAHLAVCLASELIYTDFNRSRHLARTAVELVRLLDDDRETAYICAMASNITRSTLFDESATAWAREAVTAAERTDDPVLIERALVSLTWTLGEHGDLVGLDAVLDRRQLLTERLGMPISEWVYALEHVMPALARGDTTEAEPLAEHALGLGLAAEQPDAMRLFGIQLVAIRRQQGRMGELLDVIAETAAENPGLPALRAIQAATLAHEGHHDEAAALIADEIAADFRTIPQDAQWSSAAVLIAEVVVRAGLTQEAATLYELVAPHGHHLACSGVTILEALDLPAGRLATLLGRHDDADRHFIAAHDLHERIGAKSSLAYTRVAWAEMLAARADSADVDRARELAGQALSAATEHGYGYVETDAMALLERIGT